MCQWRSRMCQSRLLLSASGMDVPALAAELCVYVKRTPYAWRRMWGGAGAGPQLARTRGSCEYRGLGPPRVLDSEPVHIHIHMCK